jgi:hypothetical protein
MKKQGEKECATNKKKDSKRETTLTHYRNSKRQIEMESQPKKRKNKECVCA